MILHATALLVIEDLHILLLIPLTKRGMFLNEVRRARKNYDTFFPSFLKENLYLDLH